MYGELFSGFSTFYCNCFSNYMIKNGYLYIANEVTELQCLQMGYIPLANILNILNCNGFYFYLINL